MPAAIAANHRWSMDFLYDRLVDDYCSRILKMIDDFTGEAVAVAVEVDISLSEGALPAS